MTTNPFPGGIDTGACSTKDPMQRLAQIVATIVAFCGGLTAVSATSGDGRDTVASIPLTRGLTLVSALRSPSGDRENVVTVDSVTANGVTYTWRATERDTAGKPVTATFNRFVRKVDLASAPRIHTVHWTRDNTEYPGYTGWSISSATYEQLRTQDNVPFTIVELPEDSEGGVASFIAGAMRNTVKLKGALTAVSRTPEGFPVLVNGRRVTVPALHVRGQFTDGETRRDIQFWALADSAHPLLLKIVNDADVLQTIRVELPTEPPAKMLEAALETQCRAELPGIFFAFGTADLDQESDRTLSATSQVLTKHADWAVSIEGHTDNIGSDAANQKLSEARAQAVRRALSERYGVAAERLRASGFGKSQPRESNDTLEGRARNRRVEIVRPCAEARGVR